jgi:hypothetical protein
MNFFTPPQTPETSGNRNMDREADAEAAEGDPIDLSEDSAVIMPRYSAMEAPSHPSGDLTVTDFQRKVVDEEELNQRLETLSGGPGGRKSTLAAQIGAEKESGTVRFDPGSHFVWVWLILITVLGALSASMTGYYMAFPDEFSSFSPSYIFDYLVDLIFVVHILFNMNVGYMDYEGTKVMDASLVRARYFRSADFFIDVLSVIPTDLIQAGIGWNPVVRINRLLRLVAISKALSRLRSQSINPTHINMLSVAKILLIWLLLPHYFTVIRISLLRVGTGNDPWKNKARNLDPLQPHTTTYLRNLHWCMGVMSGYSDGTIPEALHQYVFTLVVLNIGLFFFAYTVRPQPSHTAPVPCSLPPSSDLTRSPRLGVRPCRVTRVAPLRAVPRGASPHPSPH